MNVSTKTRPVYFSLKFQWLRIQLMEAMGCRRCSKPCVLSYKNRLRLWNNFEFVCSEASSKVHAHLYVQKRERGVRFQACSAIYSIFVEYLNIHTQ